ncbi:MAG: Cof-type HAD-IIB family hydrolase [Eubacterium sp.]|nr:Cof-type HAD-IIB family hydrolase [Eubacterium sp.]
MIKLLALDLDGTTLLDSRSISEENRRALNQSAASGTEIVVASGRVLSSLPESVFQIPGVRYAITSNGAAIYRIPSEEEAAMTETDISAAHVPTQPGSNTDLAALLKRNSQGYSDGFRKRLFLAERIHHLPLSGQSVLDLLKITADYPSEQFPLSYETFIDGVAYAYAAYVHEPERFGASRKYIDYIHSNRIMEEDIRQFIYDNRNRLDLVVGDAALCHTLREKIIRTCPDIYTTSSVPNRVENSTAEAGKGSALRFLLRYLSIDRMQTVAFGDADNDIDMLRAAGVGIAMANGTGRCKAAADYVTRSCLEDGLAYALMHILPGRV